MSTVIALLAIFLKLAGVAFLFTAALGMLRFRDVLQRMHAATKAGTVGAGLVVLGTVLALNTAAAIIIGALTVVFLLLTVPISGHLLGRAAYVSGAPLVGIEDKDALQGVLPRNTEPEERHGN